ncbi:MAG TPA: hypothetical protein VF763_00210 [Candidatus Limnocylindrales bacterium]
MDVAHLLAVVVHTIAFVIAWGYYGILGRIVLPALERSLDGQALGHAVAEIERRALPLVGLSGVLFTISGSYLLAASPRYAGLGNLFASGWTTLLLAKHVVVVAFVVLAAAVDLQARRIGRGADDAAQRRELARLSLATEVTTGLGAIVVILTAVAQGTQ